MSGLRFLVRLTLEIVLLDCENPRMRFFAHKGVLNEIPGVWADWGHTERIVETLRWLGARSTSCWMKMDENSPQTLRRQGLAGPPD